MNKVWKITTDNISIVSDELGVDYMELAIKAAFAEDLGCTVFGVLKPDGKHELKMLTNSVVEGYEGSIEDKLALEL